MVAVTAVSVLPCAFSVMRHAPCATVRLDIYPGRRSFDERLRFVESFGTGDLALHVQLLHDRTRGTLNAPVVIDDQDTHACALKGTRQARDNVS